MQRYIAPGGFFMRSSHFYKSTVKDDGNFALYKQTKFFRSITIIGFTGLQVII